MPSQRFGAHIIVTGTAAQLAFAAKVYAGFKAGVPFVGDLEPKDFPIEFHTAAEMYAMGAIIPNSKKTKRWPKGQPAFGFTFPTYLAVNSDVRPKDQAYALEHEPYHPIVAAHMTATKAAALHALVEKVIGGTRYQNRLSEVLCDAFVELFYGHSIEDAFYGDIANSDLQKAWDILMETTPEKPAPVDPPAPLPLDPKDAQIADLQTQLDTASVQIDVLNKAMVALQAQRSEQDQRLAAKDAALRGIQTGAQSLADAATRGAAA